jgi:hypothetical protein
MDAPKPEQYAIDTTAQFAPDTFIWLEQSRGLNGGASLKDITSVQLPSSEGIMSHKSIGHAKITAEAMSDTTYRISRKTVLKSAYTVSDSTDQEVCAISSPMFSRNIRKFTFPVNSPHSNHYLEMKPVGLARKAQYFVQESVVHFWEGVDKDLALWKTGGNMKIKVAEFGGLRAFSREGLLVVASGEVDVVVAIVTCFSALNRSDSFSRVA